MAQRNHIPAVEQSIVNVLIERGFDIAKGRALFDQAHDYGEMWGVKEKLLQDIAERGVTIVQPSGVQKKNDSVDCLGARECADAENPRVPQDRAGGGGGLRGSR